MASFGTMVFNEQRSVLETGIAWGERSCRTRMHMSKLLNLGDFSGIAMLL